MSLQKVVLFSPGEPRPDGNFNDVAKGKYWGGDLRMRAAVAFMRMNPLAHLTLVGGHNERAEEGDCLSSRKVDGMFAFLAAAEVEAQRLSSVPSLPCTRHNWVALYNIWLREGNVNQVTMLTNRFHMERVRVLGEGVAKEMGIQPPAFDARDAETILGLPADYIPEEHEKEYRERLEIEESLINDFAGGQYGDRCRRFSKYLRPAIIACSATLLTANELEGWGLV